MKFTGIIRFLAVAALSLSFAAPVFASDSDVIGTSDLASFPSGATLNIPAPLARMSPELALQVHEARLQRQARELGAYSDTTVVAAELPKSKQQGSFRLQRVFSAPGSLAFKAVNFVGDGFVKTNVIARLLQSEADHAKKGDNGDLAISSANYKFTYRGVEEMEGGPLCHVFQVKPRDKRAGLFKGTIYLNVYTGAMFKAEGKMVKSPSFFVKNIEFSQQYTDVGGFDMVTHIHSTADAKFIGQTIVDITHSDLRTQSVSELRAAQERQYSVPVVRTVSYTAGER
jgi:hypothetical protein